MSETSGDSAFRRRRLPRATRLRRAREFRAVYAARVRRRAGPLTVYGRPGLPGRTRLGLSVPRRVGSAVRRNRIKRLLREAFRHLRPALPDGYDLVVNIHPHEPLPLADYEQALIAAVEGLHETWSSKQHDTDASGGPPAV